MEALIDRARRIVEPVLGTPEDPILGGLNLSEGLNRAVNLLRTASGVKGMTTCERQANDPACGTCGAISACVRICELVRADEARKGINI